MGNSGRTVIHFNLGGYYSDEGVDVRWNRVEARVYTLIIKKPMEEVSFNELVDRICRKIAVDEATKKLKYSYIPLLMNPKMPSYIFDDDDVVAYLQDVSEDHSRSVLNVEIVDKDVEVNQISLGQFSGVGQALRADVTHPEPELASDARVNEVNIGCEIVERCEDNVDELGIVPFNTDDVTWTNDMPTDDVVYVEWEDGIGLTENQEFESKKAVQQLVERAVHKNCFQVATVKSTTTLLSLKCRAIGCKWSLRVARRNSSSTFSVRTYNKMHTCSRASTSTSSTRKKGTPSLVASILADDYAGKFNTPAPKDLIDIVQGRLGVKVSYSTAWRGKFQAASEVRGSPEESFMMLPSYLYMLQTLNPGTVARVEVDENQRFKYLFFALGACIEGFKAMRKVIIVDGTHIKTAYGGVLIVAAAQDPEHHHYPIAFGVVDGEKDVSWRWFLETLKTVIPDDPAIVFVSDRNASIIKTIGEVYPLAKHGYCIYHMSQNVKLRAYGVSKEVVAAKFRECAKVYTESAFMRLYDMFRDRYPTCAKYLDDGVDVRRWARCYFPGERYNIDTTNCVESINGVFAEARKYALLPMIDVIVGKLAEWFNKHRISSAEVPETQKVVPSVEREFHERCAEANLLSVQVLNSSWLQYNVIGQDGKSYLVDLRSKTCACRYFDIDGYPCVHAIAANSSHAHIELHDLCSKYYKVEFWAMAYHMTIFPVSHRSDWIIPEDVRAQRVLPPECQKRKGRNRSTRIPSVGEYPRRSKRYVVAG